MKFFKRENTIIKSYNTTDVDGTEIWIVSWDAFHRKWEDNGFCDVKRVAKSFLNEDDAKTFEQSIYDALILLQFAKTVQEAKYFSQLRIEKQS